MNDGASLTDLLRYFLTISLNFLIFGANGLKYQMEIRMS